MEKLKEKYQKLANEYVDEFAKMFPNLTGIPDMFWVGEGDGCIGGTIYINDFFVDYEDVRYIVDNDVNFDTFFDWYEYCTSISQFADGKIKTPTIDDWCNHKNVLSETEIINLTNAYEKMKQSEEALLALIDAINKGRDESK